MPNFGAAVLQDASGGAVQPFLFEAIQRTLFDDVFPKS
jgi:hypothetical protein